MKNDSLQMEPFMLPMEQQKKTKSIKVSTPVGEIESDSGNHLVDIGTIFIIILIFFAMKRFFKAT